MKFNNNNEAKWKKSTNSVSFSQHSYVLTFAEVTCEDKNVK